ATIPALPTINATDGSPITGVAEAGSVVIIKDAAGVLIGTATADPVTGAYSIVPTTVPANGTVLNVTATDVAGNSSAPVSIKVDATIPALPTINATDGSPITGVAEAGSLVTIKDALGAVIGTGTADAVTGAYSIVPKTVPANGTVLNVIATDAAGNTSIPVSIKVDATAPALPTINATDGSPITGVTEAGSVVTVKDAAGALIGTATADPVTGAYSIVPKTVPANGTVLNVTATDAAGNSSVPVSIKVDAIIPALPTINATDGSPITGVAEAGSVVTVKDAAGVLIGTATADPVTGAYSIVPKTVPANGTVLNVTATDAAGNTSVPVSIKVDATAPALPTINATDGSPITGVAEAGSVITVKDAAGVLIGTATADPVTGAYSIVPTTVPLNGTVLNVTATDAAGNTSVPVSIKIDATIPALPTINATDGSPITGVAEVGSVVTIKDAAGTVIGTTTADPVTGAYSIVPTTVPLNGTVLNVTATDAAGNTSVPVSIKVDVTAPALSTINATDGSSITGVAEAGSVVTIKDAAGTVIGTATADPVTGAYSIVPTTVPANGTVLNVTATDVAGNTSAPISIKVDATAPALPTINATDGSPITGVAEAGSVVTIKDAAGTVIGTATADPVTGAYSIVPTTVPANGTVLNVTATDAAGNTSALVSIKVDATIPALPTINATDGSPITGVAEAGSLVTIKDALGAVIGTGTADALTGAYNIVPSVVLIDGALFSVTATDAAGNVSPVATTIVDAAAPVLPTINATDGSLITGVAEAGSFVTIKDALGAVMGTGTADAVTGAYSIVPSTVPADGVVLSVTATDAAGNVSPVTMTTVDATAPALPTINATDGSPITGVAEAGSLVTIKDALGAVIGTGTADAVTGAYNIVPSVVLID
ncbi:Ig-like domain-containing protein, partial [Crenothrix polyspora]|uniref:Ig-like domain-containing protein n=1 Tax=Crenothrix polyspora TaxID=360316 RepID=UPI001FE6FD02